ncbi:S-type pyocin domain-containing protein [Obesumbacterium proteus]|uniref:Pyosin/cloacin translocation domain-containing protein n=1 Tax=Obesumbacterium proteus ATCC 12841 TaxID=1354268 RepID=A0AA91IRH3_9GAMM|nr:S-type pyocin domain-containing protein [Obesumbacterium proteus]OAT60924.1 hypothetical protein M993_00398 [Obesumbacterium proteus ATCC 12841]
MRLAQLAEFGGKAPTRVRFRWEDDGNGHLSPKGCRTPTESGLSEVPVRGKTAMSEKQTSLLPPIRH